MLPWPVRLLPASSGWQRPCRLGSLPHRSEQLARDERQYAARLDTYGEAITLAYQMQAIAIQSVVAMDSGELMPDPEGHYDTAKTLEVAGRMEVGSATLSRPADLVRSVSKKSAGRSCS